MTRNRLFPILFLSHSKFHGKGSYRRRFEANEARLKMGVIAYNLLHLLRKFHVRGEGVRRSIECLIGRLIKYCCDEGRYPMNIQPLVAGDVAVITGGASGIGRALADTLITRDLVVVLADRDEEALAAAVANNPAIGMPLDVTDLDSFIRVVDDVIDRCGRIDVLFNNAGVGFGGELRDLAPQDWDDWMNVINVNLLGVVHEIRAVYPHMVKRGKGRIVNTSSAGGLFPLPMLSSYTASKYAVVGLSHALRAEARDLGVGVSVICPGRVKTAITGRGKVINIDKSAALHGRRTHGISPQRCAEQIMRGVDRNAAMIVITHLAKALWLLNRLSPKIFSLVALLYMRGLRKYRITETI